MRAGCWLLSAVVVAACGGHSTRGGDQPAAGDAMAAGGTDAGGVGSAIAGAAPVSSFVPDDPRVSKRGDGRLSGGSFEGKLGDGWDFCCKAPLAESYNDAAGAADGSVFLRLDSKSVTGLDGGPVCSNALVGFWLDDTVAKSPLYLYFDVRSFGANTNFGTLYVDTLEGACMPSEPLATIPLSELDTHDTWQTRCVALAPTQPFSAFGLRLTGEPFELGLDAFRFGPPCHAP